MKYITIFNDFSNQNYFYFVFDIKNVSIKNVRSYIEKFYSDLKHFDYQTDIDLTTNWNYIKNYTNRFDNLLKITKKDLNDINDFLFMRRYTKSKPLIRLDKSLLTEYFLRNYPELEIL